MAVDKCEYYLRGFLTRGDQASFEQEVCDHPEIAGALRELLDHAAWDPEMSARARAMFAVCDVFDAGGGQSARQRTATALQEPEDVGQADQGQMAAESSVVQLVNTIIAKAVQEGADQIEIVPTLTGVSISLSAGLVRKELMTVPRYALIPIVARLKLMADIDPETRGATQRGMIAMKYHGDMFDIEAMFEPTADGEAVILSVLR